ncbi:MAG: amidohydrolase family protein [Elusimicrobiota bacterium]
MHPVIDAHIHVQPSGMLRPEVRSFWLQQLDTTGLEAIAGNPSVLLRRMDAEGIERAGLISYVSPDVMGFTDELTAWVAAYASADPSRLIAFGSVNPRFTDNVADALERAVQAGIRALKLHPPHQLFAANAYLDTFPALARVYERAQSAGIPVTVHTGTSNFPGARNRFAAPMPVDDVAVDFPRLTILLAHGGRPVYMEEAFFLVRRHPNVHLELSGIPPMKLLHYFPRLEEIADKAVWGTDWPSPGVHSMAQNVDTFLKLPLTDLAKKKILYDNARRIFVRR